METARLKVISKNEQAVIAALKNVYFEVQHNMPNIVIPELSSTFLEQDYLPSCSLLEAGYEAGFQQECFFNMHMGDLGEVIAKLLLPFSSTKLDRMVVFTNKSNKDMMQSFSLPFLKMMNLEVGESNFGTNYIKGNMIAEPGGNWEGTGKFKMWFKSGGAIEFGQAILRAGQLASRNRQPQPPPYSPPQGPFHLAPPTAYIPPHGDHYDWVPYQAFPSAPPPEYVYTCGVPPPYPGVDPDKQAYPPPQP